MSRALVRRVAAAGAVALLSGVVVAAAGAGAPAAAGPVTAASPGPGDATLRLAGPVTPAAPDASSVQTISIPLSVTNRGDDPLYDLSVSSLRSAPITTSAGLRTAFDGDAITPSGTTQDGPTQDLGEPLAPGQTRAFTYTVDSSSADTGICLCFLGVYALDVTVSAASAEGGARATVGRVQTYMPSLTGDVTARAGVGWLWPLLDRPHRRDEGTAFVDDDLAASVSAGGRLDRALQVVEELDATDAAHPGAGRSLLLLVDPEILAELVTMTEGYTVSTATGTTPGTGGPAARAWLSRLAAVLPHHDVRSTLPSDPDVVGLADRGMGVGPALPAAATAGVAAALGTTAEALPAHDLAWPLERGLDTSSLAALVGTGAHTVVTTAATDDDGALARLVTGTTGGATTALLADPGLTDRADAAVTNGHDTAPALQQLVVSAAMTSVRHPTDNRYVLVAPDRDLDVDPSAAVAAVLATDALGTPTSPVAALGGADDAPARSDLLSADAGTPPAPLPAALDAATTAGLASGTIQSAVVDPSAAAAVVGDLPARIQRAVSSSWPADPSAAASSTAALVDRATSLRDAVQVVVNPSGNYSLASADAPLLLTVANNLPVDVRIRVDVRAVGQVNGFVAGSPDQTVVPARSRPTLRIPTTLTRSGRFVVVVSLRSGNGQVVGMPQELTVTSTAVGAVGTIVTYAAGVLLVLALVVRGVRRWRGRSRAGSDGPGPDSDAPSGGTRPRGSPTVPASP